MKLRASTPGAPVNPEVFRLYLEGRQEWNRRNEGGFAKAQTLFDRAIALDPTFARAYAGLADVWINRTNRFPQDSDQVKENYARAGELADRALGLDPNLAEAYTTRAQILSRSRQYDAANAAFLHALALNPNYSTAHHWFGLHLFGRGRIESGLAELEVATRLDPLSPVIALAHGLSLNHARRWRRRWRHAITPLRFDLIMRWRFLGGLGR